MVDKNNEESKIETVSKSFRLAQDVVELVEKWAEEQGVSQANVIQILVRTAAEDEKRITRGATEAKSVLQDEEVGASVIQIRTPRTRDELADVFTTIMYEVQDRIGENDRISALGVTRARVYKLTRAYQERKTREGERFWSPYEDEKGLAKKLSETGGAGNVGLGMREKGVK